MDGVPVNPKDKEKLKQVTKNGLVAESLINYIENCERTGQFVHALLSNDLKETVSRHDGRSNLRGLVKWLYNYAPSSCWGSEENVQNWLRRKKDNA